MPRHSREKSDNEICHAILRGIDRRNVFEDDEDNERFLTLLDCFKAECDCDLLGILPHGEPCPSVDP